MWDIPLINFNLREIHDDELYFDSNQELARVLEQGNAVFARIKASGGITEVCVCFPSLRNIRVYVGEPGTGYLVGQAVDIDLSTRNKINYRYGMEFSPWLFFQYIPHGHERRNTKRITW